MDRRGADPDETRGSSTPAVNHAADRPSGLPQAEGYELVRLIGRGGMGAVYEGIQRSTGRRVAVKFMLEGLLDSEPARRRFEREIELIARLEHPHIVSVVDARVTAERCFYVMEYLDGQPLDRALPAGTCDPRAALRVMRAVCDAVDYAHQRGVLHRDLKPSNTLVDARGEPHLLDFGLAKALAHAGSDAGHLSVSQPGQLLGTLAFMSPEQSRGDTAQVSVRSDVYSLGAMAYFVLTGRLPVRMDGAVGDVLARIAVAEPARPSQVRGGLSRDIDAILLKALEKQPAARYATAADLAAEIDRYLSGRPIHARRAGPLARTVRWVRRNRAVSAVAAAGMGLLIISIGVSIHRLAVERDLSVAKVRLGEGRMLLALGGAQSASAEARLREAVAGFRKSLAGPDEMLAEGLHEHGRALFFLSRFDEAEADYREALALRRAVLGEGHPKVAATLSHLAQCVAKHGDLDEAERLHRAALAIRETWAAATGAPDANDRRVELAMSLSTLAQFLVDRQGSGEAEPLFLRSIEILESLPRAMAQHQREGFVRVLNAYALCRLERGDCLGAQPLCLRALELVERHFGRSHPMAASVRVTAARAHLTCGDAPAAMRRLDEAQDILDEQEDPSQGIVADAATVRGEIEMQQGRPDAAESAIRRALEIRERVSPDDWRTAALRGALGECLARQGRLEDAKPLVAQSHERLERVLGPGHARTCVALRRLLGVLDRMGDTTQAEALRPKLQACGAAMPTTGPP